MQKKLILILTPLALILAFLFWWFSAPQVIMRRSASIIDCVAMEPGTGRLERSFKAENLRDLIDEHLTILYPEMQTSFKHPFSTNEAITLPRDRAKSALLYLTEIAEWITVTDTEIQLREHDESSAIVDVSFKLDAKLNKKPQQSAKLKGTFEFSYTNNRWLLAAAKFE
ncbi:hypothetical protein [Rubritalea sp.]|uniref:hypothetical protein n=1 Tax=Rubritalea sp. TaxID=2109375 RepID=UPI003EF123F8